MINPKASQESNTLINGMLLLASTNCHVVSITWSRTIFYNNIVAICFEFSFLQQVIFYSISIISQIEVRL